VNARFGKKQELIREMKNWWQSIGKEIGQTDFTLMTGSVGAAESLVTVDIRCKDMAELNQQWEDLAKRADHVEFGSRMEPLLVSGSTRWEIFRVIE
jgi:hypothetical protein